MARMHRRISRPLIAVLVLAVGLGAFSLFHKSNKTRAAEKAAAAAAAPVTASAAGAPAAGDPGLAKVDPTALAARTTTPIATTATPAPSSPTSNAPSPAAKPAAAGSSAASPSSLVSSNASAANPPTITAAIERASTPAPPVSYIGADRVFADAKAQADAGKLIDARALLNGAVQSGKLSDADADQAKALMAQLNQKLIFSTLRFNDDAYTGSAVVAKGQSLARIAAEHDVTWELLAKVNGVDPRRIKYGQNLKVINGPFFAVVDKKRFTLDLYLGGLPGDKSSMYVETFRVGLGRDDSTPTGLWQIDAHAKLRHPTYYSPRGEGVIPADDPRNPLGPCWISLTGTDGEAVGKQSYGMHGTIDPDSIGKQSSMGCIRMRNEDALQVFDLMTEGKSMVLVK